MKKNTLTIFGLAIAFALVSFSTPTKLVSSKTHIKFFSSTPAEDIVSNNYKSVSTIDPASGKVVFSVPMQSFEFEKALMQKHFNSGKFLKTKKYPKSKFIGTITNLSEINFDTDGVYEAKIKGELTIMDKTNPIDEKGTITIKGSMIEVNSVFNIALDAYGITFTKGVPSTNIANDVEVTVAAEYNNQ
ncbi:MAG: YceI family protein [Cyclobacteriaceae bacterium]